MSRIQPQVRTQPHRHQPNYWPDPPSATQTFCRDLNGNTQMVVIVFTYGQAEALFPQLADGVPVICIDLPRSSACFTLAQAQRFFTEGADRSKP